jgi:hypothetical protein
MGRFDKTEPKLNEVKAVLQRLQGFPEDEKPVRQPPPKPRHSYGVIVIAVCVVLLAGGLGAAYLFTATAPPEPQKAIADTSVKSLAKSEVVKSPAVKSEAAKIALETARALMAKGQVRAAREQLLALAAKGSSDAAWDVARSYDPNWLGTLPEPDAAPDIPEAERWYRTWYEAAVNEGTVGKNVSIERIIGAMQR